MANLTIANVIDNFLASSSASAARTVLGVQNLANDVLSSAIKHAGDGYVLEINPGHAGMSKFQIKAGDHQNDYDTRTPPDGWVTASYNPTLQMGYNLPGDNNNPLFPGFGENFEGGWCQDVGRGEEYMLERHTVVWPTVQCIFGVEGIQEHRLASYTLRMGIDMNGDPLLDENDEQVPAIIDYYMAVGAYTLRNPHTNAEYFHSFPGNHYLGNEAGTAAMTVSWTTDQTAQDTLVMALTGLSNRWLFLQEVQVNTRITSPKLVAYNNADDAVTVEGGVSAKKIVSSGTALQAVWYNLLGLSAPTAVGGCMQLWGEVIDSLFVPLVRMGGSAEQRILTTGYTTVTTVTTSTPLMSTDGASGIFYQTSDSKLYWCVNKSGTIKKVELV